MTVRKPDPVKIRIMQTQLAATRHMLVEMKEEERSIQQEIESMEAHLRSLGVSAREGSLAAARNQKDFLAAPAKKRTLSAAARKRIAASTRARWAEFRKQKAKAAAALAPAPAPAAGKKKSKNAPSASLKAKLSAPFVPAVSHSLEEELSGLIAEK